MTVPTPAKPNPDEYMDIKAITTGPFEEICYLISNETAALVIDPGFEPEKISAILKEAKLRVAGYVCTHAHTDHINALSELHAEHPAPILMHSNDWKWAFEERNALEPYYSAPRRPENADHLALETKKDWELDDFSFRCIETPGHSPGSCCLHFKEAGFLIAGDTLFKGSCGRTDLPGGDPRQLKASLEKLKQLPGETRVFPGHGPGTTIDIERATNFYMQ